MFRQCWLRLLVGASLVACATSCSGGPRTDAPPVSTDGSSPAGRPTAADASPRRAATTPSPSSSDPVIGPPAVRVLSVKSEGAGIRIEIVGLGATTYQLRTSDGLIDSCSQTAGPVDASPLPGLPPNAVHHASLMCSATRARAVPGFILAQVDLGDFNYKFTVPVGS